MALQGQLQPLLQEREFFSEARLCTTQKGKSSSRKLRVGTEHPFSVSFLDMIRTAAATFPPSVYDPPPETASNVPALNLTLGSMNVSLGGPSPGVFRTDGKSGPGVQADGLRDGVRSLLGKVREGVDRIGLQ